MVIGLLSARGLDIAGEPGTLNITRDITARRQLEEQNLRSAQLAAIGQLAAGVAHEINNPINGVIIYTQLLLNRSATRKAPEENLQLIIEEGNRGADIVKELLFSARDSKDQFSLTSVESLLQSVLTLSRKYIERHGIRIATEIEPGLPAIYLIPQKIEQVLINLMNNSRYALDEKYSGSHPDKRLILKAFRWHGEDGDFCRLVVRDQGVGIPEALLKKISEPFFTTKPADAGTGLGMSICREIVAQHRGEITIDSVQGQFTEVTVDLPLRIAGGTMR